MKDDDLDNASMRAKVVQRTVPPPEDDHLTWRYAVQLVAADSLALVAEVRRQRAEIRAIGDAFEEMGFLSCATRVRQLLAGGT